MYDVLTASDALQHLRRQELSLYDKPTASDA
jgi:hypothetical protein